MPDQSQATGAVFLSYASQDADAAARICEALRAAGIEVWFDRSELRGGDAWDSQIKKQIHDCALFVPLISAHTNARSEGYFRGEWNLATRRLANIAHDAAFLVPVVVDESREADARVPEEFLRAQWTWLPGGETPPAFASRVRQLLDGDKTAVRNAHSGEAAKIERSVRRGKFRVGGIGIALIVLLLALGAGAVWYSESTDEGPTKPAPGAESPSAVAAPNDKSIAVLPFVNMSSDPEQEYFSDGMSEQVLNLLSRIPKLRVIARTSSFAFKDQKIAIAEIAKKLDVAHVLEGSVRKSSNKLRVTVQLIRASDSSQQWSETYDRELTDIFAIQDEIALAVVRQLKLALMGGDLPARSAKTSLEAYTLFLRGQHLIDEGSEESQTKAEELFEQAIAADPLYADAWAALANIQGLLAVQGFKDASAGFTESRASAQKALELDPKLARAHFALGAAQFYHDWDWLAAEASFTKVIELDPSDPWALAHVGALAQMQGKSLAGISLIKQAVSLDPISVLPRVGLAMSYLNAGQLEKAEGEVRTLLELSPELAGGRHMLGTVLLLKGQTEPAVEMMRKEQVEFWRLAGLSLAYHAAGQKEASNEILKEFTEKYADVSAYQIAEAHAFRDEKDEAFAWLDRAYRQHDAGMTTLNADPLLEKIRSDPRYSAMLRKMKLPKLPH